MQEVYEDKKRMKKKKKKLMKKIRDIGNVENMDYQY